MSHQSDTRLSWQRVEHLGVTVYRFGGYVIKPNGGWWAVDFDHERVGTCFTLAAAKRLAIAHLAAQLHGREHVKAWERQRSRNIASGRKA